MEESKREDLLAQMRDFARKTKQGRDEMLREYREHNNPKKVQEGKEDDHD